LTRINDWQNQKKDLSWLSEELQESSLEIAGELTEE
jgi:hypothetical protein